jgi:hypothetical protein
LKLAKAAQLYPGHTTTISGNVLFHLATENYSRVIELSLEDINRDEKRHANFLLAWLVKAYSAIGNREEARKCLARLETLPAGTPYKSVFLTLAFAGLGDLNEFFVWARRAIEEKVISFGHLRLIDREIPGTGMIRQDPRFIELFKKVGLEA